MREDIYGGLKNALERGIPLEQAIQSFINAGYASIDVREAAQALDNRALPVTTPTKPMLSFKSFQPSAVQQPKPLPSTPSPPAKSFIPDPSRLLGHFSTRPPAQPAASPAPLQPVQQQQQPQTRMQPVREVISQPREGPSILLIVLISVLVLSIGFFIASLLFKEQIASFFSGLSG